MFIRTASERDLPAISKLLGDVWLAAYDPLYGAEAVTKITGKQHSVSALKAQFERPRSEFLVADDSKTIAGAAYAAAPGDDARIVDLVVLAVHPDLQGRGVGGMLLQEIESSFFETEILRLDVEAANLRAVGFFAGEGFVEKERKTIGAATLLRMEKVLA